MAELKRHLGVLGASSVSITNILLVAGIWFVVGLVVYSVMTRKMK
jgi:hypothetical protein